ncbi:MAG: hypothetical protein COA57_03780 [Flavobacteriales bacterium]|nr:MAG: hypothetical protein COA57_03780 [Flavobacteriales bacterium]
MKKYFILITVSVTAFAVLSFISGIQKNVDQDWNACIQKVNSKWGTQCEKCVEYKGYKRVFDDTYKVWLANTCGEAVDVKCCVQEENKTWRCFFINGMGKKDTLEAYACKGTGKYLKWTKKAGDSEISFPSDEEVNEQYKD